MFTKTVSTRYVKDREALFRVRHYPADNSPALQLYDPETEEPLLTASICLIHYDLKPRKDAIFIKDYSENEGIQTCLERLNLIGPPIMHYPHGYVVFTEHMMQNELLDAWHDYVKQLDGEVV